MRPGQSLRAAAASRLAGAHRRPAMLIGVAAVLSGVDWLLPMSGVLSYFIAAALTALVLPWALVVVRGEPSALAPPPVPGRGRRVLPPRVASALFHGTLLLLLLGFVSAKWLVLLRSGDDAHALDGTSRSYTLAILLVFGLGLLGRGLRGGRFVALAAEHPARLMALSFGTTGLLGALLLSLPVSVAQIAGVSLVDNLFTAFSAVCVTGLTVNVISQTYSTFGQAVLCALVQLGGLGIMVLSAAVIVLAGRRMRVRSSAVLAQMVDASSLANLRRTVAGIVLYTLAIEAAGAALLYWQFSQQQAADLAGAGNVLWAAVFHAVSAFCNAGISNLHAGLQPFQKNTVVAAILACLVVLGGLGFPVLDELARAAFTRLRRRRLRAMSLHTRVALRTSGLLLAIMALAYLLLEWRASMHGLTLSERLTAAVFQSAAARSSGFNLVDIGAMTPAALVLTCAAMFIGASPGSTGGGIKTTTVAVLFAGLRAELASSSPRLLDRTVPMPLIRKAIGVSFLAMLIVFAALFVMLLLEPHEPLALAFEVVSAFSTTGLSTGITPELSVPGKLVITLSMFVGRIGPLTLALAISLSTQQRAIELPDERVMIG